MPDHPLHRLWIWGGRAGSTGEERSCSHSRKNSSSKWRIGELSSQETQHINQNLPKKRIKRGHRHHKRPRNHLTAATSPSEQSSTACNLSLDQELQLPTPESPATPRNHRAKPAKKGANLCAARRQQQIESCTKRSPFFQGPGGVGRGMREFLTATT